MTSINRGTTAEKNRRNYAERREKTSSTPQSERTRTKDITAAAASIGRSYKTLKRKLDDPNLSQHDLEVWFTPIGGDVQKLQPLTSKSRMAEHFGYSPGQVDGGVKTVDKLAQIESLAHAPNAIVFPTSDPAEAHSVVRRVNVDEALRAYRRAA